MQAVKSRAALILGVGFAAAGASGAGELSFTRLVGTGDRLWPAPAALLEYATAPHAGEGYVVFSASATRGTSEAIVGVWLWDGASYHRVIDSTMPEGQAGILTGQSYSVDETGLVAVNVEAYAMMGWKDGSLFPILLTGAEPPGGPPGATIVSFSHPIVHDATIYFRALAEIPGVPQSGRSRVYSWSVDEGLVEFDLGGLEAPSVPVPADGGTYIKAYDDTLGWVLWFRSDDGTLTPYLQANATPFPGGPPGSTWRFYFDQPGVLDHGLALGGIDDTLSVAGLYRHSPETIETVVLRGDPDPVSGLPNQGFFPDYAADGDRIAFSTVWGLGELTLIVQQPDRSLVPIVATLGLGINGEPVPFFSLTYGALAGDRLVFGAWQASDAAVWMVDLTGGPPDPVPPDIPTLGGGMLAVLGLGLALFGVLEVKGRRVRSSET